MLCALASSVDTDERMQHIRAHKHKGGLDMRARAFKKARLRLKLTQADLSRMTGIARESISRIENDHMDAPLHAVVIMKLLLRDPSAVDYVWELAE